MMHRWVSVVPLLLAACAPSLTPTPGGPTVVPIEREPHHHVVYESPLVRIFDVRVDQGDTTGYHVHAHYHAGVLISGSARWGQGLGEAGELGEGDPAGAMFDNATSALPYTHRVANVDAPQFRYVMGQFLAPAASESGPLPAEPGMKLERETSRARIYRIRLLPGQETSRHRHAQPSLMIQATAGTVGLSGDAATATSRTTGAGAWWWREAGNAHSIRNTGSAPLEVVEIDWRGPAR